MNDDNSKNMSGSTLFCKYGTLNVDEGDIFAIGCGADQNNRTNCITAGTNTTDGDYIKIGDTKITETQLQALLATLS